MVDNAWDDHEQANNMGVFDNLHLFVTAEGEIDSKPETVVGDTEFNRQAPHDGKRTGDQEL